MRTNDISQWENVYLSNKNTFASCNKRNLEVYRCIREEEYETLEKCAEYWIENRSHAAFVHFFIEKVRSVVYTVQAKTFEEEK